MRRVLWVALSASVFAGLIGVAPSASQVQRDISRCFSIADVNQRVECLEGRTSQSSTEAPIGLPKGARVNPSFECRAANHPVEAVICNDPQLAELDGRMGSLFVQLNRQRNGDVSIIENQRLWLFERERVCNVPGLSSIASCIQRVTAARVAQLQQALSPQPTASPALPPTQTQPVQQSKAPVAQTSIEPTSTSAPPTNSSSGGDGAPVLLVIGMVIGALWLGVRHVRYRRRRADLIARFGERDAMRILAREVWQGMTEEQLKESWGLPEDRKQELKKTMLRETLKYGQTGKNRFAQWVFLENGIVIGWKN